MKALEFLIIVTLVITLLQRSNAFISSDVSAVLYHIDREWVVVCINEDASVNIQYNITITYESSALGYLTIGLPTRGFDIVSVEDLSGNHLSYRDVSSGSYYGVEVYFGDPMSPGESGAVLLVATVPNMLSHDTMNPGHVGMQFIPTYFDAWTNDLRVTVVPPKGVTKDTIITSEPVIYTTVDDDFAIRWEQSNIPPNTKFTYNISIPEQYIVLARANGVTIVDLFYVSSPQFTDDTLAFLNSKNLEVNTFRDSEVTVDFYRQLPQYGYTLLVLRVHAGVRESDPAKPTFLFTKEPYNTYEYLIEQISGQVQSGKIDPDNPAEEPVFTVGPLFVAGSMEGMFNDSIVILSGSYGLYTDQLADAFIEKGVKAFISWNDAVGLTHTDDACTLLIRSLIEDEMTIDETVERVRVEVGSDPDSNSQLEYYPENVGNLRVFSLLTHPPVVHTSDPYFGTEGVSITFNGSDSYDPDGIIVDYEWSFGDGSLSTNKTTAHVYTRDGIYIVTLTVVDDQAATRTGTTTANISDIDPISAFEATPLIGALPLEVTFTDESTSYDGISLWSWDFGDGGSSSTTNPTHTYITVGTYTITLTVYEDDGDSSTQIKADYVTISVPWWQEYWYLVTAIVVVTLLGSFYGIRKVWNF